MSSYFDTSLSLYKATAGPSQIPNAAVFSFTAVACGDVLAACAHLRLVQFDLAQKRSVWEPFSFQLLEVHRKRSHAEFISKVTQWPAQPITLHTLLEAPKPGKCGQ